MLLNYLLITHSIHVTYTAVYRCTSAFNNLYRLIAMCLTAFLQDVLVHVPVITNYKSITRYPFYLSILFIFLCMCYFVMTSDEGSCVKTSCKK